MERGRRRVRPYRPADRDAIYEICLRTGDVGEDASALYPDPLLLGHIYAGPYLTREPELAFVLEDEAGVCGYVLGASDTRAFRRWMIESWLPPLRREYPEPDTDRSRWTPSDHLLHQIHFPQPVFPPWLEEYPSHLHIDLLPRARGAGHGRALMERFLTSLAEAGSPGVHLGVDARNLGAQTFYRKLGFEELADPNPSVVRMVRMLPRGRAAPSAEGVIQPVAGAASRPYPADGTEGSDTMSDLASKQCVPCMGGVPPLAGEELRDLERRLGGGWRVVNDHHLEKTFEFNDFREALDFTNRLGELAEEQGHHPDIHLSWGKVGVEIFTHKIDGLTESDFVLAAKTDRLQQQAG